MTISRVFLKDSGASLTERLLAIKAEVVHLELMVFANVYLFYRFSKVSLNAGILYINFLSNKFTRALKKSI